MNHGHALEFGVRLPATGSDPERSVRWARSAEDLGLDLVVAGDRPDLPAPEAWTLLSWIAGVTTRVRLTTGGHDDTARNPAMLARAVAGLDHLSGGRVELGLTAGGAACETLDVVEELWNVLDGGLARVQGDRHRLAGAQKAAPAHEVPVTVGGPDPTDPGLARLAGARADGWSVPLTTTEDLAAGMRLVDRAARDAGRDPREIRRWITVQRRAGRRTVEAWATELRELVVEHGVGTIVLDTDDHDTLVRFAREVVPAVRAGAGAAFPRGAAGVRVRRSSVLARRRPGIDYDGVPAGLAAVVEPGDLGYARLRSGYLRGGSPGIVLQAATTGQVVKALGFARRHPDLPLSRRSAGHGVSGRSTNDGGIVIDVSPMNTIEVLDEATRRVRIGPGARWTDVATALAPHGWAISSGDYGGVGVGGLATAGGLGYLARAHGLTIDHLRAVEMVLADGEVVRCSEQENPDLFWAVRGAGANFGIVTSFEFEADVVGPVAFAALTQDARDTARYLVEWGRFVENSPRDLTSFLIVPPSRRGRSTLAISRTVIDSGDPDTVLARLEPLAAISPMYEQDVTVTTYADIMGGASDDAPVSRGEPISRSGLLRHVTPEFASVASRVLRSGDVHWFQLRSVGGAVADVDPDATAYAHREANFSLVVMGADADAVDAQWALLAPYLDGMYLSFESGLRPERIEQAWPPRTLARLRELKATYDPDGVFDDNFALTPSRSPEESPR
ncbi:LLM class flavin-dependent oxidoreductase [Pseudonocardia nematodicida]|uniref:LLM class flavin-dependent oxidoreductase n=1 Tax=Pseudonocardia nematodicida TaxID=1206997 RepID=A0ABV1K9H6_9PSEU